MKRWLQAALRRIGVSTFSHDAFGTKPRGFREGYLNLHQQAISREFPEIQILEDSLGYSVESDWLSNLALHTQVVHKESELNWQHGRVLYSLLRQRLEVEAFENGFVQVFETGSARGFSALCLAKAMIDSRSPGVVLSLDSLPHNYPMYWNCIDDFEGRKSRRELLAGWPDEVSRVIFLNVLTPKHLNRIGIERIHFAFLDAQHTFDSVMQEYYFVEARQSQGDLIVFDDVTPGVFDGVVAAVNAVSARGLYEVESVGRGTGREYAVARRIAP